MLIRSAWVTDDAMISLRTVRNFVDGYGLVWNVGERVQAFTHPLWVLLLIPVYFVTNELFITVIVVNLAISLLAIGILITRISTDVRTSIVAVLILALSVSFVDYSTSGLENGLTHLLIAVFIATYSRNLFANQRILSLSLLLSFIFLNRFDIILIVLPGYLHTLWQHRQANVWRNVIFGAIPSVSWLLFALVYYGFLFPNTAYAKLNTGIPKTELAIQGMLYLVDSVMTDPVFLFAVLLASYVAWQQKRQPLWMLLLGTFLYSAYIIYVGGDFMAGRFVTAPLFVAVSIFSHYKFETNDTGFRTAILLAVFIGLLGVIAPVMYDYRYRLTEDTHRSQVALQSKSAIVNERGVYFDSRGLATMSRDNRLWVQGDFYQLSNSVTTTCGGLGDKGLRASPNVHIIDSCALSDPLLARIPAIFSENWRTGHAFRHIPQGYEATILTGDNMIVDENLALYYTYLSKIIQGPLFSFERLQTIINLNLGRYDYLIDTEKYMFPDLVTLHHSQVVHGISPSAPPNLGIKIAYDELLRAEYLLLNYSGDRFRLRFFNETKLIGELDHIGAPVGIGRQSYHIVKLPNSIQQGFTSIHILNQNWANTHRLAGIEPISSINSSSIDELPLEQLLKVYTILYLRSAEKQHVQFLDQIQQAIVRKTDEEWAKFSHSKPWVHSDLLRIIREPDIRAKLYASSNLNILLNDAHGNPVVRLIGYDLEHRNVFTSTDEFRINLYFQPLAPLDPPITIWMHAREQNDGQLRLFDRVLDDSNDYWRVGTILEKEWLIELPHSSGTHQLSFGFWNRELDIRLLNSINGTSWIDLPQVSTSH